MAHKKLGQVGSVEYGVLSSLDDQPTVFRHDRMTADHVAGFACELLQHWRLADIREACHPKDAEEIVKFAFDVAEATYAEARKRGLLVDLPDYQTIRDESNQLAGKQKVGIGG